MKRVPAPITIVTESTTANASVASSDDDEEDINHSSEKQQVSNSKKRNSSNTKFPYSTALPSPHGSAHSFDIQVRQFLVLPILSDKFNNFKRYQIGEWKNWKLTLNQALKRNFLTVAVSFKHS